MTTQLRIPFEQSSKMPVPLQVAEKWDFPLALGLSLTSPPGPLSKYWRGGEKRILKSPLHAMGRGFRGGVNA